MTAEIAVTADAPYYDPWNVELNVDPYPMFKRLRDEMPLYYNDVHDFYALSRFDDVNRVLVDHRVLQFGARRRSRDHQVGYGDTSRSARLRGSAGS